MNKKNVLVVSSFLVIVLVSLFCLNQYVPLGVSFAQEETSAENNPETTTEPANVNVITASKTAMLSASLGDPYQIANIAEAANPATVYIQVKWPAAEADDYNQYWTSPFGSFFDNWFFPYPQSPSERVSQGTGFIIDPSGIVVTNHHVIGDRDGEQEVTVTVSSPTMSGDFKATILGSDARLDLAVLQIEGQEGPFPTVPLGDSDQSRPGEWVIAIGNPYGKQFDHTVTVGVLSAKGREITIMADSSPQVYENLMQTDAAINSGNSGGPLLNIQGEVIGINTAVHAEAQGIGFAIPINVAKDVLEELIETGEVAKTWLGIYYLEVDEPLAAQLRLADTKGVVVTDVVVNSPAEQAGLQAWDVIRRIGNLDITSEQSLADVIASHKPGDKVLLTILRGSDSLLLEIELGNAPANVR